MASITAIRDALKDTIDAIAGLNVHATRPTQIVAPAAVVTRRSGPRPATFGPANYDYDFAIMVLTSLADDTAGQEDLDAYLAPTGTSSIQAKLDADPDLGDVVEYAAVTDVEADQIIEYGALKFLGAEIIVTVGSM